MEFQDTEGTKFKVTRRIPALNVAETQIFIKKEEALRVFHEWLN